MLPDKPASLRGDAGTQGHLPGIYLSGGGLASFCAGRPGSPRRTALHFAPPGRPTSPHGRRSPGPRARAGAPDASKIRTSIYKINETGLRLTDQAIDQPEIPCHDSTISSNKGCVNGGTGPRRAVAGNHPPLCSTPSDLLFYCRDGGIAEDKTGACGGRWSRVGRGGVTDVEAASRVRGVPLPSRQRVPI